jgi:hypothetical protein
LARERRAAGPRDEHSHRQERHTHALTSQMIGNARGPPDNRVTILYRFAISIALGPAENNGPSSLGVNNLASIGPRMRRSLLRSKAARTLKQRISTRISSTRMSADIEKLMIVLLPAVLQLPFHLEMRTDLFP